MLHGSSVGKVEFRILLRVGFPGHKIVEIENEIMHIASTVDEAPIYPISTVLRLIPFAKNDFFETMHLSFPCKGNIQHETACQIIQLLSKVRTRYRFLPINGI